MNKVPLYPTIPEEDIFAHINSKVISFSYITNNIEIDLIPNEEIKNEIILNDATDDWSMEEYGFTVRIKILFKPIIDFKSKYISRGTKISLALEWSSAKSKVRSVEVLGALNEFESTIIDKKVNFSKNLFRGNIDIKLILFISSPGHPVKGEEHFANITGLVVGEFNKTKIILDGHASLFPILLINNSSLPLWKIELITDDPYNEPFSESFSVYLNQAHPDYKYINTISVDYNTGFLREVLSSIIIQLIIKLKNEGLLNNLSQVITSGDSLIDAMIRYQNDFGWSFDSIEIIHEEVKLFFDKEFK